MHVTYLFFRVLQFFIFIKINPEEYEILEIENRNDMDEIQVKNNKCMNIFA